MGEVRKLRDDVGTGTGLTAGVGDDVIGKYDTVTKIVEGVMVD